MEFKQRKTIRQSIIAVLVVLSFANFAYTETEITVSRIDPAAGIVTMVNVLTPTQGKQAETIRLLQIAMNRTMRHQPGFISANIHRSLDSEHVVVYAQWKDQASVEAVAKLIQAGEAVDMVAVFSIAKPAYHPYAVVSVHSVSTTK